MIFLDLDNFKLVNDSLGHAAGDHLLAQLADRLKVCTRETDLVARQGGDEFLLLLSDLDRSHEAGPATETAMAVAESVATRVRRRSPSRSTSTARSSSPAARSASRCSRRTPSTPTTLMKNADAAMYQSKRQEPGGYVIFATSGEDPMEKLSLTTRLRRAVEHEHWVLHYQPVVNLLDGSVEGVEALVRWHDPNGGIVPPGEFIPLAEELGLIEAIGDWVIDAMAAQQRAWVDAGLDLDGGVQPVASPALVRRTWPRRSSGSCARPTSTPRGSSSRSPSPRRWPTPIAPRRSWPSCAPGACRSRSTTSAPGTRRSPG